MRVERLAHAKCPQVVLKKVRHFKLGSHVIVSRFTKVAKPLGGSHYFMGACAGEQTGNVLAIVVSKRGSRATPGLQISQSVGE